MFEDNRLEVEVAIRYYYEHKTQSEIAKELDLSRVKVQRLLQKCMDTGIVRVLIEDPLVHCINLGKDLKRNFGLKEAYVVMTPSNKTFATRQIAVKTASVFDSKLRSGMTVGVSWGRMVHEVVNFLEPKGRCEVNFVSVVGGLTTKYAVNPFTIIHKLGELYHSDVEYLPAPAVVDSTILKEAIMKESLLESVFRKMDRIELCMVGIGNVTESSTLFETGYVSHYELEDFRAKGAVGEVLLYHYDIYGRIIESDFHDRMIVIGSDRLKSIDTVIGVAGGQDKVESIIGAVLGGFVNVLITDEDTARRVLEHPVSQTQLSMGKARRS